MMNFRRSDQDQEIEGPVSWRSEEGVASVRSDAWEAFG